MTIINATSHLYISVCLFTFKTLMLEIHNLRNISLACEENQISSDVTFYAIWCKLMNEIIQLKLTVGDKMIFRDFLHPS